MEGSPLVIKSLKEQVYEYLRGQIHHRVLTAGMAINLDRTSRELGISRTPLRDALIQLEMEGFVTIKSRRGIYVNDLTQSDIEEFYQVIGALEQSALMMAAPHLDEGVIAKMNHLNEEMKQALTADEFEQFYSLNLSFHDHFLQLCHNSHLVRIVGTLKKRLYDFSCQEHWLKDWELSSVQEHAQLIKFLQQNDAPAAARYVHDVHWGFDYQKPYIMKYYFPK